MDFMKMIDPNSPIIKIGISSFFASGAVKILGKTREGHLVISLKEPRVESDKIIIKDDALKRIIIENIRGVKDETKTIN